MVRLFYFLGIKQSVLSMTPDFFGAQPLLNVSCINVSNTRKSGVSSDFQTLRSIGRKNKAHAAQFFSSNFEGSGSHMKHHSDFKSFI